jgi:hypothetical protein
MFARYMFGPRDGAALAVAMEHHKASQTNAMPSHVADSLGSLISLHMRAWSNVRARSALA